ncbi:hypothetical protein IF2G_06062 [Cordyceps javanica]|nr:hypothetical protein IF2G_06062 [Cordyceps javanica]
MVAKKGGVGGRLPPFLASLVRSPTAPACHPEVNGTGRSFWKSEAVAAFRIDGCNHHYAERVSDNSPQAPSLHESPRSRHRTSKRTGRDTITSSRGDEQQPGQLATTLRKERKLMGASWCPLLLPRNEDAKSRSSWPCSVSSCVRLSR